MPADTFHTYRDQNGVTMSANCHSEQEFGPAPSSTRPSFPHLMLGPEGPYVDPAPESIVHKTKDKVLFRLGSTGGMTYSGDLLPRAERIGKGRSDADEKGKY